MDLTALTDDEARDLLDAVYADVQRRTTLANAPARAEALATAYAAAIGRKDGDPWVQPTGAHDAYAKGITVTHGGKTWESLTPANVWTPGVSVQLPSPSGQTRVHGAPCVPGGNDSRRPARQYWPAGCWQIMPVGHTS